MLEKRLPSDDELEGMTEMQPDLIPNLEQDEPIATYADWTELGTRVITCALGNSPYEGVRYDTREQAIRGTQKLHGKIYEANYVPGRAFFRVSKKEVQR